MSEDEDLDLGVPGASARREHERRRANRERRVLDKHPRVGRLLLTLRGAPRHETAWSDGGAGEEASAAAFAKHCSPPVIVLHDRRIPGTRTNIDHLAVCPNGVWVIDTKRYAGKVAVHKPWFGEKTLRIGGRDKTKLIEGLHRQVETVRAALVEEAPGVFVNGAISFFGDGLPAFGNLVFDGYPIRSPKRLAKLLNQPGELTEDRIRELARKLQQRFPSA